MRLYTTRLAANYLQTTGFSVFRYWYHVIPTSIQPQNRFIPGFLTTAPNMAVEERASKRIRTEDGAAPVGKAQQDSITGTSAASKDAQLVNKDAHHREREVGILRWVNEANTGFEGILKQR
jgi:hypothetical protein